MGNRIAVSVGLVAMLACDRFWHLRASAAFPAPLPVDCVRGTLQALDGVDSVWVRDYSSDTATVQSREFLAWSERGLGTLVATGARGADSLRLELSWSWVGPEPSFEATKAKARQFTMAIARIGAACWAIEPPVSIEWPR